MSKVIFDKEYSGESIADVYRDICEAVDQTYNPKLDGIPVDEHGFQKGKFVVSIVWTEE